MPNIKALGLSSLSCIVIVPLASAQPIAADLRVRPIPAPIGSSNAFLAIDRAHLQSVILDHAAAPANKVSPKLRQFLSGSPKSIDGSTMDGASFWSLTSSDGTPPVSVSTFTVAGGDILLGIEATRVKGSPYTLNFELRDLLARTVGGDLGTTPTRIIHDRPILFPAKPLEVGFTSVDMGAKISRAWFKGNGVGPAVAQGDHAQIDPQKPMNHNIARSSNAGPERPLVGIEVDQIAFKAAAHKLSGVPFATLDSKIDELFTNKLKNSNGDPLDVAQFWCVDSSDAQAPSCTFVSIQPGDKKLTIVLHEDNSYNSSYKIGFMLSSFIEKTIGTPMPNPTEMRHKDSITWQDRGSLVLTSSIVGNESSMITVKRDAAQNFEKKDGKYVYNKDTTSLFTIKVSYLGFDNPFRSLTGERSYYNLAIDTTLSTKPMDSKSDIRLAVEGVTNKRLRMPGNPITIFGSKLLTSQSLRQTTLVADYGWRWGDKRSSGSAFHREDEVLGQLYGELAIQGGGTVLKRLKDVPDPKRTKTWIVRPRMRLGFHKFLEGGSSLISVTGFVDWYYLDSRLGGGDDPAGVNDAVRGLREEFGGSISFGSTRQKLTFTIKGGTNPAAGFVRVTPTYSVGLDVKF